MTATAELAADLAAAIRSGERLLPVAGGTKPALSDARSHEANTLDVSHLRGIIEYDPSELTFTALAATPVSEIASALAEHDQYLPFDPLLADAGATLAGTVAAAASGPGALRHGGVRDFVIGVRFIDGLGNLVSGGGKVVKNAAGFDLPKLMVGSRGRLGVMVELSFKVFPRPKATTTLAFELSTRTAELAALSALRGCPVQLCSADLAPDGRLLVRVGGESGALGPLAERVRSAVGAGAETVAGDAERMLWNEAQELRWVPAGSVLVRVPISPRQLGPLDERIAARSAAVRYALAGNLALIAWPADRELRELDAALTGLGLSGTRLLGGSGDPAIGRQVGGSFGARIRAALDPDARFLEV